MASLKKNIKHFECMQRQSYAAKIICICMLAISQTHGFFDWWNNATTLNNISLLFSPTILTASCITGVYAYAESSPMATYCSSGLCALGCISAYVSIKRANDLLDAGQLGKEFETLCNQKYATYYDWKDFSDSHDYSMRDIFRSLILRNKKVLIKQLIRNKNFITDVPLKQQKEILISCEKILHEKRNTCSETLIYLHQRYIRATNSN
jgi:hypothetical protein